MTSTFSSVDDRGSLDFDQNIGGGGDVEVALLDLRSEAAFANLCGAAPIEASSGKTVPHRLNPHGNREANRALYVVALNRMRRDLRTQTYVARRTTEGKSKREIIRCLKRYIAREVYRALVVSRPEIIPGEEDLASYA